VTRRAFIGLVAALLLLSATVGRIEAQASLKAIIVSYEFSEDEAPAGQLALEVRYFTYGAATSKGSVTVTIAEADTAAGIRTKILDAVVADVKTVHGATIAKSAILLPTYGQGS